MSILADKANIQHSYKSVQRLGYYIAYLRIAFGFVWLFDAILKFNPSFYNNMIDIIKSTSNGNPSWLDGWYSFWLNLLGSSPHLFTVLVILIECIIAFSLLFGFARKIIYALGIVFSLLLWSVGEGFGSIFIGGETDPNAGIIYALLFSVLYFVDGGLITAKLSIDTVLEKQLSWWRIFSRHNNS